MSSNPLVAESPTSIRAARNTAQAGPAAAPRKKKADEQATLSAAALPLVSFGAAKGREPGHGETAAAVGTYLSEQLQDRVEHIQCIRDTGANTGLSDLQHIQVVCNHARKLQDLPPLAPENPVWSLIQCTPEVTALLAELSKGPEEFIHQKWAEQGILENRGHNEPETETDMIHFYIRSRLVPQEVALKEESEFIRAYPVNIPFVVAKKWSRGCSEEFESEVREVLGVLGYGDAPFQFPPAVPMAPRAFHQQHYLGATTALDPALRQQQDQRASKRNGGSLHLNLLAGEDQAYKWTTWKIVPLSQKIDDPLEVRRNQTLSDLEAVLINLVPTSSNSQPGGFTFQVELAPPLADPIRRLADTLPPPSPALSDPTLEKALETMMRSMKTLFSSMRELGLPVGPEISEDAFANCLRESSGKIRVINGMPTMLTVMKDTPAEVQRGAVNGALFEFVTEIGHAIRLHRNVIQYFLQDPMQLHRMGPHIDFWMVIIIHRWWGCLVLLVGRFIRVLNPLVLHTHSSMVNGVIHSPELINLCREFPDGKELTVNDVTTSRLSEMQAPAEVRDFVNRPGTLPIMKTGVNPEHRSILASNYDPGAPSYHASLRRYQTRLMTLVTCKELALDRVAERLATEAPPSLSREDLLKAIVKEVEKLCNVSGLNAAIESSRADLKTMHRGFYAFSAKKIIEGRLVRTGQGKTRQMKNVNLGIRARGAPYSQERFTQLEEIKSDYAETMSRQGEWKMTGTEKSLPGSTLFDTWLLSRAEDLSLRQSSNNLKKSSSVSVARLQQDLALVERTHAKAVAIREKLIDHYGSWAVAEFSGKVEAVFDLALKFRGKVYDFVDTLRIALCTKCNAIVTGYDRNAKHLCKYNDKYKDSKPVVFGTWTKKPADRAFSNYLVVLHVHDILQYPGIGEYIDEDTLERFGIFSSRAEDWLFDENGQLLPSLPTCFARPGVLGLDHAVFHQEDTPRNIIVAAAVDVVLRANRHVPARTTPSWSFDDSNSQGSQWHHETLGTAINLLATSPADFKVSICPVDGCGYTHYRAQNYKHKHDRKTVRWISYKPKNILDLPYCFSRPVSFRGMVENCRQSLAAFQFNNP